MACHLWKCTEPFLLVTQYCVRYTSEILLLSIKVSSYYHQLALSQATGDKGPTGPGGFPPDPFQYLQAQVGPVGPRGPPGMINGQDRFMVSGGGGSQPSSLPLDLQKKKSENKWKEILPNSDIKIKIIFKNTFSVF